MIIKMRFELILWNDTFDPKNEAVCQYLGVFVKCLFHMDRSALSRTFKDFCALLLVLWFSVEHNDRGTRKHCNHHLNHLFTSKHKKCRRAITLPDFSGKPLLHMQVVVYINWLEILTCTVEFRTHTHTLSSYPVLQSTHLVFLRNVGLLLPSGSFNRCKCCSTVLTKAGSYSWCL